MTERPNNSLVPRWIAAYGCVSEFILALLLYSLFWILFGTDVLYIFINKTSTEWTKLIAPLVAANLVMFGYLKTAKDPFINWMESVRAISVYTGAYFYSMIVFLVTSVVLCAYKGMINQVYAQICLFFLTYSLINFISVIKNTFWLFKLQREFKKRNP